MRTEEQVIEKMKETSTPKKKQNKTKTKYNRLFFTHDYLTWYLSCLLTLSYFYEVSFAISVTNLQSIKLETAVT